MSVTKVTCKIGDKEIKFETGKLYFHEVIQIQTQKPKLRKLVVK